MQFRSFLILLLRNDCPADHELVQLTLVRIHPPRVLQLARITDYRDFQSPISRREWTDVANFVSELLRTRYSFTLKVRLAPHREVEK